MCWPPPDTDNICSQTLNETYEIPGFCSPSGPLGDGNRKIFCTRLGAEEWKFKTSAGSCKYSWCDNYTKTTGGCCNLCCSVVGRGALCQRVAFTADATDCCFSDYTFSGNGCVISPESIVSRTCDPNLRDITGIKLPSDRVSNPAKSCRTLVLEACTDVDSEQFIQNWSVGGKCIYAINRNLFGDRADTVSVLDNRLIPQSYYGVGAAAGIIWSRNVITQVVQNLEARGKIIPSRIGDPAYTPFQETFIAISKSAPGIVTDALKNNICNGYSADNIVYDQTLTRLCGCYLPEEQYERYANVYGVSRECTPTCSFPGAVKVVNEDGYTVRYCEQDVCIIDNVNILLGSNNSDINFSQLCGGCGPDASCRCFISGYTIDASSGLIGDIDIRQGCGSDTTCTDDEDRPIDCDTGALLSDDPLNGGGNEPVLRFRDNPYSSIIWFMFVMVLLLIILLIAVNNDKSRTTTTQEG